MSCYSVGFLVELMSGKIFSHYARIVSSLFTGNFVLIKANDTLIFLGIQNGWPGDIIDSLDSNQVSRS